ncbi:hypothetical protein [Streptomyces sp. NPDC012746]|uniref:hypothetical protein n=1 Tax=Streptomyces sp. NPDC012746 TaxID=3364845 RepID=UPI0036C51A58
MNRPNRPPTRLRHAGTAAFLAGALTALAFFAFFPGLPHVIDWGAIIVSLAIGALTRWAWQRTHAGADSR